MGISISDPDATGNITTTLSVLHGTLYVLTNVLGGLTAAAISGNGTGTVILTGTQAQIDNTLAATNGLIYNPGTGNGGYAGTHTLTVATQDQGTVSPAHRDQLHSHYGDEHEPVYPDDRQRFRLLRER